MNYHHGFHAGNFADVFKHATLCRILTHLHGKPAAFRVIDTHAGAGSYDLTSDEARRGGEWQNGIARIVHARRDGALGKIADALLAPYLDIVAAANATHTLSRYPGSPAIVRALLRPTDKLIACEIEPRAHAALSYTLRKDARLKALAIDGFTALSAYVPPPERRGLVVVDPPFERDDDFERMAEGMTTFAQKWATGMMMLWYPIKRRIGPDLLAKTVRRADITKALRAEFSVAAPVDDGPLVGNGLIIINPPWTLESELHGLLPVLGKLMAQGRGGGFRIDQLGMGTG